MSRNTQGHLARWARDLLMGIRFSVSGGREGWIRTLLTGIGVGLGVALLLITTALPSAFAGRDARADARSEYTAPTAKQPDSNTLLIAPADTRFHNQEIYGRLLQPEGPNAPVPPGLTRFPAPGEMAVSPSLGELLKSADGQLLRARLPDKTIQLIGNEGLLGPTELAYYAGSSTLEQASSQTRRITGFDNSAPSQPLDPVLTLLILLVFTALLTPVAVFITTAMRFGGERRDRRLAALRLIGADGQMARRIAAGEALAGSLAGLAMGAGFFLLARRFAARAELDGISVFPADLNPTPWLTALVTAAVPAAAVAMTLLGLRGVVIEPLGVVRTARPTRRRLWWRLLLPLAGLGLLAPMTGMGNDNGYFDQRMVIGGVVLLLAGITVLLPWLIESVVARLGSGPVSWQLAVRRLQINSAAAARLVSGIAVAVAGAIALQMMFTGIESNYTRFTGQDPSRAALMVSVPSGTQASTRIETLAKEISRSEGIRAVTPLTLTNATTDTQHDAASVALTIGSCTALREVAVLDSCKNGDTFILHGGEDDTGMAEVARPGRKLHAGLYGDKTVPWTLPADAHPAASRPDPTGTRNSGILATTSAAPQNLGASRSATLYLQLDPAVPDAIERARTAVARQDPTLTPADLQATARSSQFQSIHTGLLIGATCVLLLIGASLLVSQLEQLRERKKLLSALVAFGTRRTTIGMSVLWQTALPVTLGLLLSTAAGLALGTMLLQMSLAPVTVNWPAIAAISGVGAGVILLVTLLSLPPLWRLMRPDGLRTE
ncbi:FtsX-like permease family protein [Streptomyces sp. NPDC002306]